MQSGKDPDYATGKTKRNGTAGTERSRQTRNATGKPGTQPADPERNRQNRYGTQLKPANPVRNTTGTGQPGTEPEQNTTE